MLLQTQGVHAQHAGVHLQVLGGQVISLGGRDQPGLQQHLEGPRLDIATPASEATYARLLQQLKTALSQQQLRHATGKRLVMELNVDVGEGLTTRPATCAAHVQPCSWL
jgi:hypothetical protein